MYNIYRTPNLCCIEVFLGHMSEMKIIYDYKLKLVYLPQGIIA